MPLLCGDLLLKDSINPSSSSLKETSLFKIFRSNVSFKMSTILNKNCEANVPGMGRSKALRVALRGYDLYPMLPIVFNLFLLFLLLLHQKFHP